MANLSLQFVHKLPDMGSGGRLVSRNITAATMRVVLRWLSCLTVPSSSNKPTMTKENFTKFLNEKQRDSRLNEELFPRLRQDQIKALIDKYEPCSSNTNRSEIHWCRIYFNEDLITLSYFSVSFLHIRRSDFSRRSLVLPDGAGDISCHPGQAGQVSGHDPTFTPLLHQVLPQHIPDRLHTPLWYLLTSCHTEHLSSGRFFRVFLCISLQLVSSLACPLQRCTASVCCPAAAVWSWTAGRANLQMKSPSLPTASPWRLRSSSRCLLIVLGTLSVAFHIQIYHFTY